MYFALTWLPLFGALGAVVLAVLLNIGRPSLQRMARLLAGASVVGLAVELATWVISAKSYTQGSVIFAVVDVVTNLLATAAWVVLLCAAALAGHRRRMAVLTLVLTLALVLQIASSTQGQPLLNWLYVVVGQRDETALILTQNVLGRCSAIAALLCALLAPAESTSTSAVPTGVEG